MPKLQKTRVTIKRTIDRLQDEEFNEILHNAERIEFLYSHLFDEIIVNADLSMAFEQLVNAIHRVESEPLWVPASWVQ